MWLLFVSSLSIYSPIQLGHSRMGLYNTSIAFLLRGKTLPLISVLLPSRLGLQNTQTASLQRGKTPHPNKCPGYDTKQSTGEASLMLELWGMWSTPSLSSLSGSLWPGVIAPDRTKLCAYAKMNCLK